MNTETQRTQRTQSSEDELASEIIGASIEVHRLLGPGLLEKIYERAFCYELGLRDIAFERQCQVPLFYKDAPLGNDLRLDLLVDQRVIVDLKAKRELHESDKPQMLSYLRLTNLHLGLIINFHGSTLTQGVYRVINGYEPASKKR